MKRNTIITPITFNVLNLFQKFHGVSKLVRNIANSASFNFTISKFCISLFRGILKRIVGNYTPKI